MKINKLAATRYLIIAVWCAVILASLGTSLAFAHRHAPANVPLYLLACYLPAVVYLVTRFLLRGLGWRKVVTLTLMLLSLPACTYGVIATLHPAQATPDIGVALFPLGLVWVFSTAACTMTYAAEGLFTFAARHAKQRG